MDPRPYNYEFRKPRPSNRTYQSYNAYESLYHMGKIQPFSYNNNIMREEYANRHSRYAAPQENYNSHNPQQYGNGLPQQNSAKHYENTGVNTDNLSSRVASNRSDRSHSSLASSPSNNLPIRPSVLSTYGSNSLEKNNANAEQEGKKRQNVNIVYTHVNDSLQIYEKQQRPFDIITMYSKPTQPLRRYPKLTKEHLLLEKGMGMQ